MDGKNINKVKVEAVEETGDETSTSLIYKPKDGKWQRPFSVCDSTTSNSSLSESDTDK